MLQNATPLKKSAPWPPNISYEHVFCTAPATRNASLKILFMSHACHRFCECHKTPTFCSLLTRCTLPCDAKAHLNVQKWSVPVSFLHFWLQNVLCATAACTFSTSQLPKVVRSWCVLYILTSKCASRHNGVHFFDIWTSEPPKVVRSWCFVHFDLQMCVAPQWRALFRHLNFQKWSGADVCFVHFDLQMWSRHNGVHFLDISTSKSGPELVCFVHFDLQMCFAPQRRALFRHLIWPDGSAPATLGSLLFHPPERQIIRKTQCFATFPPFRASASSFFWLFLFSDLLSSTLLFSLPLPIYAFCPYCRKFDF